MANSTRFRGLVAQLYATDFPAAQSAWVEEFLVLLVELRRAFGNDLDKVIVLSIIGQRLLRDPAMPVLSHVDAQQSLIAESMVRNTNIDAIARVSRIPRESVRRKVGELIADGLVQRDDSGGLAIRAGAAARLAPSTHVSIAMLDAVVAKYLGRMCDVGLVSAVTLPRPSHKA